MILHARSKDRPYHFGPFPLEALPRDDSIAVLEEARPPADAKAMAGEPAEAPAKAGPLVDAVRHYLDIYAGLAEGETAPQPAPVPDDPVRRAVDIKGAAYF